MVSFGLCVGHNNLFLTFHAVNNSNVSRSQKNHLRNDLNCDEWDVKPCSTNHAAKNRLVCFSQTACYLTS